MMRTVGIVLVALLGLAVACDPESPDPPEVAEQTTTPTPDPAPAVTPGPTPAPTPEPARLVWVGVERDDRTVLVAPRRPSRLARR